MCHTKREKEESVCETERGEDKNEGGERERKVKREEGKERGSVSE